MIVSKIVAMKQATLASWSRVLADRSFVSVLLVSFIKNSHQFISCRLDLGENYWWQHAKTGVLLILLCFGWLAEHSRRPRPKRRLDWSPGICDGLAPMTHKLWRLTSKQADRCWTNFYPKLERICCSLLRRLSCVDGAQELGESTLVSCLRFTFQLTFTCLFRHKVVVRVRKVNMEWVWN